MKNLILTTKKYREVPIRTGISKLYFGLIILVLFFLVHERTNAQSPSYQWVKVIGGTSYDIGNAISVDSETGDVYTTGVFSGTVDFDPGGEIFNLNSAGSNDIFILKTNTFGNFVWALRMGGALNDVGFSIAVDASGNVYVTGQFGRTVDFDPREGVLNLTSAGSVDIFISKIDASGNLIWAKSMGGLGYDVGKSLAVDPSGNGDVYIKGEFSGTVDFDPGHDTYNLTASSSSNGTFISKLDAFGNFVWALRMGVDSFGGSMGVAPYGGFGQSITVDASGYVYTTGWFQGTADFDPGESTFNLKATGDYDIFILKLDGYGNFVWAKSMRGTLRGVGHTMAVDASGNVYTSGAFQGTVDFDPGSSIYSLTARGTAFGDVFISKLDSSGNFIWAKAFGGTSGDSGHSIVIDSGNGDIYTIGDFTGTADFDPDKGIFNLTSAGDLDIFISKLDAFGDFVWAKAIGGINADYGYSIALNISGNLHMVGGFTGPSIAFGLTTLSNTDSTGNHLDLFIAKLNVSIPVSVVDIQEDQIDIFPNPAKDQLKIKFDVKELFNVKITLYNLLGEVVFSGAGNTITHEINFDISWLPAGNFIVVVDFNGNRIVKQIVKVQE